MSSHGFEQFAGTMPVSSRQQIDVDALSAWLKRYVDGFEGPLALEQFKGGQSNPTFKLITPSATYVMRSKPAAAGKLLPSAHAIEREYAVMAALKTTAIPVAKMHALCDDESVIGRAFFIMEFIDGRVLWNPALPGMTKPQRAAIFDEMNCVIAQLHQVDYAAIGLAGYGRAGNYFERQIGRWSKQYRASETEKIESMDKLIDWLPQHIPPGEETTIVHGDYRMDNLIFHPTDPKVLAILDWELSTLGHPLADFAYHCMAWHVPPSAFRGLAGLNLAALGIPDFDSYVKSYCQRTGRAGIENFEYYLAYNLFRMAGILQGIMKRVVDGTAASEQALAMGKAARPLAELGWKVVEKLQRKQ